MRIVVPVCVGLFGLVIGSFLGVVIDRVPQGQSIVRPRSACPKCEVQLSTWENIPLISWIALRGRCHSCGCPIPVFYPLIEATTALCFAATAIHFSLGWELAAFLVLFSGLLALAVIDLREYLLPLRIVYPVLAGIAAVFLADAIATGQWRRLGIAAACGASWFGLFFVINWIAPHALGFGDVRLGGLLGLCLGWLGVKIVLVGFFAADLIGLVVAVALLTARRMDRKAPIPFGVFLALGTFVAVFAGSPITAHLRGLR